MQSLKYTTPELDQSPVCHPAIQRKGSVEPSRSSRSTGSGDPVLNLINLLDALVKPLGYELVHIEVETHRTRLLRLFIDLTEESSLPLSSQDAEARQNVGIEDCVKVARAVDEPLDQDPLLADAVNRIFHGASYELEVSSPGVERPLRQKKDYDRFSGREARIHVFRALSANELGNPSYQAKNPKQKNFVGTLMGTLAGTDDANGSILLKVSPTGGSISRSREKKEAKGKKKDSPKKNAELKEEIIRIPIALVTKANIEPRFDFSTENETESRSVTRSSNGSEKREET